MQTLPIRSICQVEVRVKDLNAAIAFYKGCFDWQIHQVSADYALIDTGQEPVGAIMVSPSPRWPLGVGNYVLVPNCAAAALYAASLGGQIFIDKTLVEGSGAFTAIVDPFGNELLFWEPERSFSPSLRGTKKNPFSWLEIPCPDLEKGIVYYSQLLRWRFQTVNGQADYAFTTDGGFAHGVGLVGGERGTRIRGTTNYVGTTDLAATAAHIKEQGGTIVRERTEIEGEGAFLLFLDKEGIRWGVFQSES